VVLTFFLQDGLHASPLVAGLTFAPLGLAFTIASLLGRRPGARQDARTMLVGAGVMVMGLVAAILVARAGAGPPSSRSRWRWRVPAKEWSRRR